MPTVAHRDTFRVVSDKDPSSTSKLACSYSAYFALSRAPMHCSYGESAWWWEAEELVRKLLLTAVAVLLDAGSPLQARHGAVASTTLLIEKSLSSSSKRGQEHNVWWWCCARSRVAPGYHGGGHVHLCPCLACGVQAMGRRHSDVSEDRKV